MFGLNGLLRRKAIEALEEGVSVPPEYRAPIAKAVNRFLEEFVMVKKPGWKTTEFWLTLLTTVGGVAGELAGFLPKGVGVIAATVSGVAYSISRGITKAGTGDVTVAPAPTVPAAS